MFEWEPTYCTRMLTHQITTFRFYWLTLGFSFKGFNMAAQRLTLTVVGFYMYIAPSMTFLLAVFFWNEPFTQGHAVAFASIWTALLLISLEQLRIMRRKRRLAKVDG